MSRADDLGNTVRRHASALGFDLVGFADAAPFDRERSLILEQLGRGHLQGMDWITADRIRLSCDPEALLPGARSVVALGTAYAVGPETTTAGREASDGGRVSRGRVARYAQGRDYHKVIPPKLKALAATICEIVGPDTQCRSFVDTGPFVDRAAASRAGLGFVGKNTCVLTGAHGSFVFLSAILTTAEIRPDPFVSGDCGRCRACLDACPTDALLSPGEIDATRCISYLTIEHRGPIPRDLRPKLGDWVFGCDVCQDVCPWNRARPASTHDEFRPGSGAGSSLQLEELMTLDDEQFKNRFGGTPLTRAKRQGLLRNAAVVMGNLHEPESISALIGALDDADAIIRGHAAWALGQFADLPPSALQALQDCRSVEDDPFARTELNDVILHCGAA
ncbi:MAG: queG [Chloroflexi bacterium]|nr:queG [Chloroflexota bacterium]